VSAASFSISERRFVCRFCGRKVTFRSELGSTRAQAAKIVGMKNTRWGTQCIKCPEKKHE
jgi:hypothetical protein